MRVVIVGGYGNAGRAIASLLARHARVAITLLGRDADRARRTAATIATDTGATLDGAAVDATDPAGFGRAIDGADLVVFASSTATETGALAAAVLDAGADWFDINLSSPAKLAALRAIEPRLETGGHCFITDGGVHPGPPIALVRFAAQKGPLRSAAVAARFELDWSSLRFSAGTRREFLLELLEFDPSVLRDRRWRRGTRFPRRFDLGPPFGPTTCVPMCMEAIRELPHASPTLRIAGF